MLGAHWHRLHDCLDRSHNATDGLTEARRWRSRPSSNTSCQKWSRMLLTSYLYPFLLRDLFTVLVKTEEMHQHILVLFYYGCLTYTIIGMVYVLTGDSVDIHQHCGRVCDDLCGLQPEFKLDRKQDLLSASISCSRSRKPLSMTSSG